MSSYNGGGNRRQYSNGGNNSSGHSQYAGGGNHGLKGGYNNYNNSNRYNQHQSDGGYRRPTQNHYNHYNGNNNSNNYNNHNSNNNQGGYNSHSGPERSYYRNANSAGSSQSHRASPSPAHSSSATGESQYQVWMGDLDPKWDISTISNIWKAAGEAPTNVKILRTDPYKPPYCFVSFSSQPEVTSAMQKNGMPIAGTPKVFKLNWASGPGQNSNNNMSHNNGGVDRRAQNAQNDQLSVFVGDLGPQVTEAKLFETFNTKYPNQVKMVKIVVDQTTGESKGFGFVRFSTVQIQQRAIRELNGVMVRGGGVKPMKVSPAVKEVSDASSSKGSGPSAAGSTASGLNEETSEALLIAHVPLNQQHPTLNQYTDPYNTTIRIKGLSSRIGTQDLRDMFISFGSIVYTKLSRASDVGYVQFLHRSAAELAILSLNGVEVEGCRLLINWGTSTRSSSSDANIKFAPQESSSQGYKKMPALPAVYGSFRRNVVFESLSSSEVAALLAEASEPQSVADINRAFVADKLARDELFL